VRHAGGAGASHTGHLSRSAGTRHADRDGTTIAQVQHRSTLTPLMETHMSIERTNQDEPQQEPQDETQPQVNDLKAKQPEADEQVKGGGFAPRDQFEAE